MLYNTKFSKQLGGKVLTVVVGEGDGKREFVVHEELICESSDFFRGAMSGEWKEAGDRVVSLPDDDPDVFALYLQAIYTGDVQLDDDDGDDDEFNSQLQKNVPAWCSVYTLAEKLMDVNIKNIVVERFYEIRGRLWDPCLMACRAVQVIYDQTPDPCRLRQLVVDAAVYHYHPPPRDQEDFFLALAVTPREFLEDLALANVFKKNTVVKKQPSCDCTHAFFDYLDKHLEIVVRNRETAQVEENGYTRGKKGLSTKGKGKRCTHGSCCKCGKATQAQL